MVTPACVKTMKLTQDGVDLYFSTKFVDGLRRKSSSAESTECVQARIIPVTANNMTLY